MTYSVWCEVFTLWICSSYFSSCFRACHVVLSWGHFTYRHDHFLHCIVSNLSHIWLNYMPFMLLRMQACVLPQSTIPLSLNCNTLSSWLMIYNESSNSVDLLELTYPLDFIHHLESAWDCKQTKEDYLLILSELDRLGTLCYYNTIEIRVLGHYLQSSLSSLCNAFRTSYRNF